jgi:hypothetical protein
LFEKYFVLNILKLSPRYVAEQLTLSEFEILSRLQAKELLNLAWKVDPASAPVVKTLIAYFNKISGHVATTVVASAEVKQRAKVMQAWVKVAEECFSLRNFSATMAIVSGLSVASIFRLTRTINKLSRKTVEKLQYLRQQLARTNSYKNLRQLLRQAKLPCLPYLGIFLVDLCMISDGNPTKLSKPTFKWTQEPLINWYYYELTAAVILQLLRFRDIPYEFVGDERILQTIRDLPSLPDQECWLLSRQHEPALNGSKSNK